MLGASVSGRAPVPVLLPSSRGMSSPPPYSHASSSPPDNGRAELKLPNGGPEHRAASPHRRRGFHHRQELQRHGKLQFSASFINFFNHLQNAGGFLGDA